MSKSTDTGTMFGKLIEVHQTLAESLEQSAIETAIYRNRIDRLRREVQAADTKFKQIKEPTSQEEP